MLLLKHQTLKCYKGWHPVNYTEAHSSTVLLDALPTHLLLEWGGIRAFSFKAEDSKDKILIFCVRDVGFGYYSSEQM